MENKIKKLYELAEVEPYRICNSCIDDNGNKITNSKNCPFRNLCGNACDNPHYILNAEKQLELIKWFIHSRHFSPLRFSAQWVVDDIAGHISFLWGKFTKTEQEEIRKILGG